MTFSLQEGANIGLTNDMERYTVAVTGGTLHVIASKNVQGDVRVVSTTFAPSGVSAEQLNTAITTVGAGTLTAAALLGGLITRSGSTAAYTDTTDTAALIQAAWTGSVGSSFQFSIINTTAFAETIAGGTGVTLAGQTIIPPNSVGTWLAVWTGTNTITMTNIGVYRNGGLSYSKYSTSSVTTGSLAAGLITGAISCYWLQTGATPGAQLVRTAAQMLADIPNGSVGTSWNIRIINSGAGTLTLTTDAGATVTLAGTMTVAQNTWRDFVATINTATTATIQSVGTGTI